jgi:hypothetical protein
MNKRLKEIMLQSGTHKYISEDCQHRIEVIAELIIRECLDQCYNRGMNDELYAGQLKAAGYIEEHFGMKE